MLRVRLLAPLLLLAAALPSTAVAAAPTAGDARLQGAFQLKGTVRASNVRGEHNGQVVQRRWTFTPECASGSCSRVRLRRQRAHGHFDVLTLRRVGRGTYRGSARFFFALSCAGRTVLRGGEAPYTVTLRITRVATVQGHRYATGVAATYVNPRRVNRTRCPGFIGSDSARYGGHLIGGPPTPPHAAFTDQRQNPVSPTFQFTDASTTGRGGARIVSWHWDFGDPGSGAANTSTARSPSHTFSSLGAHTVTLKVTDANGLTSTTTQQVSV